MYLGPNEEAWQSGDYGGQSLDRGKMLNLTKARLGDFVYAVLRADGRITSSFVMNAEFDRSYVQFTITLPKGTREAFEQSSGFALEPISQLKPA